MIKIIKFEFEKIFKKKIFLIFLILLFFINIFVYINMQFKNNDTLINNINLYNDINKKYSNKIEELEEIVNKLRNFENLKSIYEYTDETAKDILNNIKKENKNIIKEYETSIYFHDYERLKNDSYIYTKVMEQIVYTKSYKIYLGQLKDNKENANKISIFNNKKSFSYKNIEKTVKAFEPLNKIELKPDIEDGIKSIFNFKITDILLIIIIFILCVNIFFYERQNKILFLLKSNKRGRGSLIISKILVLVVNIIFISIIFYSSVIFLAYKLYGFGDCSRYIQSVSLFKTCSTAISVKTGLMLFLINKIVSLILIGSIFATIFQKLKIIEKVYIGTALIMFLCFISYKFIPSNSYINILKYLNIISFMDTSNLIGKYININLFGHPINLILIYVVSVILLIPMFLTFTIINFIQEKEEKIKKNITIKIRKKSMKIISSLFFNEFYKLIINSKKYILLIIVLIFSIGNLDLRTERNYPDNIVCYKYYLNKVYGKINEEKVNFINEEKNYFDSMNELSDKLYLQYNNNEITDEEYENKRMDIILKETLSNGFSRIYNQYEYLDKLKNEKNIDGYFIDKEGFESLFENQSKDLNKGIFITIILILFFYNFFSKEYENGTIKIILSSYNKNKLFAYKYLISIIIAILTLLIIYSVDYINIFVEYGMNFLKAPIQSIPVYFDFGLKINILEFIIITNILKTIGIVTISIMILSISIITKNGFSTISTSSVIIILSMLLKSSGIDFVEKISFVNIFTLNYSLTKENCLVENSIYFITLIELGIIFIYISYSVYIKKVFRKSKY